MLTYTQMDKRGTLLMQAVGVPIYLAAIFLGLAAASWFPGAFLAVIFGAALTYSYVYSKALYYFIHRLRPARPMWQFIVTVLAAQAIILAAVWYRFAA